MTDVLAEICAEKRAHVAHAKTALSESALLAALAEAPPIRPLARCASSTAAKGRIGGTSASAASSALSDSAVLACAT